MLHVCIIRQNPLLYIVMLTRLCNGSKYRGGAGAARGPHSVLDTMTAFLHK